MIFFIHFVCSWSLNIKPPQILVILAETTFFILKQWFPVTQGQKLPVRMIDEEAIDLEAMCCLTPLHTNTHISHTHQVISRKRFGGEWWAGTESINISLVLIAIRPPALTLTHNSDTVEAHMCTNSQIQQICSKFIKTHTHIHTSPVLSCG